MRSTLPAALVALAVIFTSFLTARAQDAPPANNAAIASLPSHPIPYAQLAGKPPVRRPHPVAPAKPDVAPTLPPRPGARLGPGQAIPPAELEAFVDGLVKDAMAREHIAGVTVGVVQNGQTILKKGYGFAGLNPDRPVDPDRTLFRIGSISKTFTWITLMKQVERGRIRLDRPINLYLPERVRVHDQGFDTPIKVINLMDHSPGFEDRALGHLFENDFDRVRPLEVYLRQERPGRVRAPGLVSSYSNYGAALAGEAVAWTSGKPFETLVEDEILRPAHLAHTTFREPHPPKRGLPAPMPAALAADISQAFRWTGAGYQRQPYEFIGQIAPAGAASSTAGDMNRYMLLLLGGGTIDGAAIYGPGAATAFRTPIRATANGVNGWAHGFVVESLPGGFQGYGHDGGTLSFFSNLVVVPELALGVFVSTNTQTGGGLSARLAPAVVRQFYAPPQVSPRPGSPELSGMADAFRGHYLATRRAYSGLEGFVTRVAPASLGVDVTPDGRLITRGLGSVGVWVPQGRPEAGQFIGIQDETRLAFNMKDGRATSFMPGGGAVLFERTTWWAAPRLLGTLALLTALAAVSTLIGLAVRNRRELRQSAVQGRASLAQNIQAGLWLLALILFGMFVIRATGDIGWAMYGWPHPWIILASACALVAAVLTLITLAMLPAVWNGGRRVESWGYGRRVAFTLTALIYLAFAAVLAAWGALSPWSG